MQKNKFSTVAAHIYRPLFIGFKSEMFTANGKIKMAQQKFVNNPCSPGQLQSCVLQY